MFKKFGILGVLILYFLPLTGQEFVAVQGQEFFQGEKSYSYIGTNYWYGLYLGSTEEGKKSSVILIGSETSVKSDGNNVLLFR